MTPPRELVRELAGRWLGERRVPVGGVAHDRRAVRRALAGRDVGRVLVVGPGLATRQALPGAAVDVAGTVPHMAEVTVCSTALDEGSLPRDRWDTVVVSDPGTDLERRLRAVLPSCRAGALLLVVDRGAWSSNSPQSRALAEVTADLRRWPGLWAATVSR